MKRSRFSEEQIAYALRLAESGTPVVDVCRQIGGSEATYRPAASNESEKAQAHQFATRPRRGSHGTKSALEHGLCSRLDARRAGISYSHGDRSVESRECVSRGQFSANRSLCWTGPRSSSVGTWVAQSDHRRQRHGIHFQEVSVETDQVQPAGRRQISSHPGGD